MACTNVPDMYKVDGFGGGPLLAEGKSKTLLGESLCVLPFPLPQVKVCSLDFQLVKPRGRNQKSGEIFYLRSVSDSPYPLPPLLS